MTSIPERINIFLKAPAFAVIGASSNREKYGNKVLRAYLQNNLTVYPVNPKEAQIENIPCYKTVADLPNDVQSLSIITKPEITEQVVAQALQKNIKNIWMQPGAESQKAIKFCEDNGMNVIADGSCALVVLKYHEK